MDNDAGMIIGGMVHVVISVLMFKVHGAKSNLPSIAWEGNDVIKSSPLFVKHFTTTENLKHTSKQTNQQQEKKKPASRTGQSREESFEEPLKTGLRLLMCWGGGGLI